RTRVAIAELAANGGAPMGFYTRFQDPEARKELVRYYRFLEKYDAVYRGNRPHAEVLLLYPRKAVHAGDVAAGDAFKKDAKGLLEGDWLFEILPDDMATPERTKPYGGMVEEVNAARPPLNPKALSDFTAPKTVRISASVPAAGGEVTLHFVNYDR